MLTPTDKPVPRHFCVILILTVVSDLQILEVKSPNDRLSNKQILWIGRFRALGVDASVCHVEAVGGKRIAAPSSAAATAAPKGGDDSTREQVREAATPAAGVENDLDLTVIRQDGEQARELN